MKKLLVLILSIAIFTLSGCVSLNAQLPSEEQITPPIIDIVPPLIEEEEQEPKKKTYIISKASSLRIRSGAGSSYSVIGIVEKEDVIEYNGTKGNYYITTYKEQKGYIHKDYCKLIEFETLDDKTEKAIAFGSTLLGYPYVWGSQRYHWGNGKLNSNFKNGEFDCSAFVQYIYYISNSILLDVTSRAQSTSGKLVERKDLKRGDLMFFTNASRKDKVGIEKVGHVGIYFGNNYILHTASDYAVIEPISSTRWSYYLHSRRVI